MGKCHNAPSDVMASNAVLCRVMLAWAGPCIIQSLVVLNVLVMHARAMKVVGERLVFDLCCFDSTSLT